MAGMCQRLQRAAGRCTCVEVRDNGHDGALKRGTAALRRPHDACGGRGRAVGKRLFFGLVKGDASVIAFVKQMLFGMDDRRILREQYQHHERQHGRQAPGRQGLECRCAAKHNSLMLKHAACPHKSAPHRASVRSQLRFASRVGAWMPAARPRRGRPDTRHEAAGLRCGCVASVAGDRGPVDDRAGHRRFRCDLQQAIPLAVAEVAGRVDVAMDVCLSVGILR